MTLLLGPQKRNPIKESPCDLIAVYFMTLQEALLKSFPENFPWKGSGEKGAGSPSGLFTIYCFWKQKRVFFLQAASLCKEAWRFQEEKAKAARMQYFTAQPFMGSPQVTVHLHVFHGHCWHSAHCNNSVQQTHSKVTVWMRTHPTKHLRT